MPANVLFIAACNPYQIKRIGSNTVNDVVFTHPSKQNLLSHRVLPISTSLLGQIHDYGALSEEVERDYIRAMMGSAVPYAAQEDVRAKGSYQMRRFLETLVDVTGFCQKRVKQLNNNASSLSLRDVHRVKVVFGFFLALLVYKKRYKETRAKFEDFRRGFRVDFDTVNNRLFIQALVVTVTLNYVNRVSCADQKKRLKKVVMQKISENIKVKNANRAFDGIMGNMYNMLVRRVRRLKKLPRDIAVNTPLKENLFAIFAAVYSRTPLFICGKPGSSKSVSVHIIRKSFDGQVLGDDQDFLDGMRPLRVEYYQGSDQSTDKGIEKVFQKALFHQNRGRKQSVVFIDEIGLAELSPNNPLKVLHKFLDTTSHSHSRHSPAASDRPEAALPGRQAPDAARDCGRVSFVGISNWDIDASKQNRNLYVARPELDASNLEATARSILAQGVSEYDNLQYLRKATLKTIVKTFSRSYCEFRDTQCGQFRHKNFHTLRDFYWMVKVFGQLYSDPAAKGRNEFNLVARAIDINFAGIYSSRLTLEQKNARGRVAGTKQRARKLVRTLQSNYIFKQVFEAHIKRTHCRERIEKKPFFRGESDVFAHVDRALGESTGRFLLLFVDRALTTEILLSRLER